VRRVAPYVLDQEKQARTVEIEAEFDNAAEAGLLAGYSADVEVVLDQRDAVLRVPTAVILPNKSVYVLDAATKKLASRTIETGVANWEYTEVVRGLAEGDRVVSSIDREGVADGAAAVPE
jgi:HlyD family secretion protein